MNDRPTCARCGCKHIGKAWARSRRLALRVLGCLIKPLRAEAMRACVLLAKAGLLGREAKLGYPLHVWYMLANMSEAEDELVDRMPEEAAAIREERLAVESALRSGDTQYRPDFKRLMYLVAEGGMLEETLTSDPVMVAGSGK